MERLDGRIPAQMRPVTNRDGVSKNAAGQLLGFIWRYAGDLCSQCGKQCAAFFNGKGERMADGRVCHAAGEHAKQKTA